MKLQRERKPGHVTLERSLSKMGIASRKIAKSWIEAGRVKVNGRVVRNPQFSVFFERAIIEIDGQRVEKAKTIVLLLNKPKGLVTTRSDEKGRPTVFSIIEGFDSHLHSVGRLDRATSGLLLLTNNTKISSWLTSPENGVSRVYLVTVKGEFKDDALARVRAGILDQGELLKAENVEVRKTSSRESHLKVELKEGKNREVRRMFLAVGHEVTRLKRISFGGLDLGDLKPGQYREVTSEEIFKAFPLIKAGI